MNNVARRKKESMVSKKDVVEIALAFLVAWLFYQGLVFATGTELPIVSVVSDSMEPVLHRGDLLFVVNEPALEVGDIVIYRRADSGFTIVHRIIEIKENNIYIIKGDNNPGPDPPVKREQILGKVVAGAPLLGYPRLVLNLFGI